MAGMAEFQNWADDLRVVELILPQEMWKPNDALDDPGACLQGPILVINGLRMHLEAWAVETDKAGIQQGVAEYGEDFESLYEAVHADGHFNTIEVGGREYIMVAYPMC